VLESSQPGYQPSSHVSYDGARIFSQVRSNRGVFVATFSSDVFLHVRHVVINTSGRRQDGLKDGWEAFMVLLIGIWGNKDGQKRYSYRGEDHNPRHVGEHVILGGQKTAPVSGIFDGAGWKGDRSKMTHRLPS
jgi:hypothetical protein